MKSTTEHMGFNTKEHGEFINITNEVEKVLQKARLRKG